MKISIILICFFCHRSSSIEEDTNNFPLVSSDDPYYPFPWGDITKKIIVGCKQCSRHVDPIYVVPDLLKQLSVLSWNRPQDSMKITIHEKLP